MVHFALSPQFDSLTNVSQISKTHTAALLPVSRAHKTTFSLKLFVYDSRLILAIIDDKLHNHIKQMLLNYTGNIINSKVYSLVELKKAEWR